MSGKKSPSSPQRSELAAELERAEYWAKHAEENGQFDTVHHTIARRLRAELAKSEPQEVADGPQNRA